jgi:hypothetical protein
MSNQTRDRSRSPSGDHSESTILKLSGCGSVSEDDIRTFFSGIEIDVRNLRKPNTNLVSLQAQGWHLPHQVHQPQSSKRRTGP